MDIKLEDKKLMDQYRQEMQKGLLDCGFWRSCINCDHWLNNAVDQDKAPPSCNLYHERPPEETVVLGCDSWLINKQPPF